MAHATVDSIEQELDDGRTVEITPAEHGLRVHMYDSEGDKIGYKHLAPDEIKRIVSDEAVKRHILLGHV